MRAVAPIVLLLTATAGACLNDRDTLVRELQSPPSVLTALTGRFERLPPAYYQARVDRIQTIARPTPEELDDLGVALDRLGGSKEAFDVMARKAAMPGLSREARYRLHANRGTFLAHHLLKTNAPVGGLKGAIADIEKAIALKPNAHFGREGVQLRVLKWIYAHRTDPKTDSLGVTLGRSGDPVKTATALAGLIELGNAWESPDVVAAISSLTPALNGDASTARETHDLEVKSLRRSGLYASLRYAELKLKGLKPLDSEAELELDPGFGEIPKLERDQMIASFRAERAAAEARTRQRAEYVETRVAAGRHPDTDPNFWSEWKEPAALVAGTLRERTISHKAEREARDRQYAILSGVAIAIPLALLIGLILLLRRLARPVRVGG